MMYTYALFQELPDAISIEELTDALQISRSFAMKLIHEQTLPAHKIARKWRILKPDLVEYVMHS